MKRLFWLSPLLLLPGCGVEEVAAGTAALVGAYTLHEKVTHPVGNLLAENPGMAWDLIAKIAGAVTMALLLAHKAGKDSNAD